MITIPVTRYTVGDRVRLQKRGTHTYHNVRVIHVTANDGYDLVRVACFTCRQTWGFLDHWKRWER